MHLCISRLVANHWLQVRRFPMFSLTLLSDERLEYVVDRIAVERRDEFDDWLVDKRAKIAENCRAESNISDAGKISLTSTNVLAEKRLYVSPFAAVSLSRVAKYIVRLCTLSYLGHSTRHFGAFARANCCHWSNPRCVCPSRASNLRLHSSIVSSRRPLFAPYPFYTTTHFCLAAMFSPASSRWLAEAARWCVMRCIRVVGAAQAHPGEASRSHRVAIVPIHRAMRLRIVDAAARQFARDQRTMTATPDSVTSGGCCCCCSN